jgi:hypothetical protein
MIGDMSRQVSKKIGRPHKGERVVTWTRLPRHVRDQAERIAGDKGWPVSDVVAELASLGLKHFDESPQSPAAEQQELPLNRAS